MCIQARSKRAGLAQDASNIFKRPDQLVAILKDHTFLPASHVVSHPKFQNTVPKSWIETASAILGSDVRLIASRHGNSLQVRIPIFDKNVFRSYLFVSM